MSTLLYANMQAKYDAERARIKEEREPRSGQSRRGKKVLGGGHRGDQFSLENYSHGFITRGVRERRQERFLEFALSSVKMVEFPLFDTVEEFGPENQRGLSGWLLELDTAHLPPAGHPGCSAV